MQSFILSLLLIGGPIQDRILVEYPNGRIDFPKIQVPYSEHPDTYKSDFAQSEAVQYLTELRLVIKKLNYPDWFVYQLIHETGKAFYGEENVNLNTLFSWYMLNQLGFDALLTKTDGWYGLYIKSKQQAQNSAIIDGNIYTGLNTAIKPDSVIWSESVNKRLFDFDIMELPESDIWLEHTYSYLFKDSLAIYQHLHPFSSFYFLRAYPYIKDPRHYFEYGLRSDSDDYLNLLKGLVEGYSEFQKLDFLFKFQHRNNFFIKKEEIEDGERARAFPGEIINDGKGTLFSLSCLFYSTLVELTDFRIYVLQVGEQVDQVILGIEINKDRSLQTSSLPDDLIICDFRYNGTRRLTDYIENLKVLWVHPFIK
ncbi:hypothetical protein [Ekhidna sp.]|jgi:hypothetical protein|uniref:hypothetical protein n=1 Tax=Ekhidna sp. TaxID=2608089 RepID=UPI0032F057DE